MDPKIINNEEDTLNPMADVRNYGAGEEDGKKIRDMEDLLPDWDGENGNCDNHAFDESEIKDDEPLPDEIVDPAEDTSEDEKP